MQQLAFLWNVCFFDDPLAINPAEISLGAYHTSFALVYSHKSAERQMTV